MGGLVFAKTQTPSGDPIKTPRMSPELYQRLCTEIQTKLEILFNHVVIPRDAPAKKDHGDIDFLVGGMKSRFYTPETILDEIKELFEAEVHEARGGSSSYAVPHPEIPEAYVQVDVEISPGNGTSDGPELFEWTRFMKGDADLLQIIGVSHRSLGLTCNDKGLHFRIKELESDNKKNAMLYLTRDPNKAMEFYGLNTIAYWNGFETETELFDWATSGRFFRGSTFDGWVGKSNDRSRFEKRPMFRRFIEDYMPAHAEKNASNEWHREQVLEEAFKMFDKQAEYDAKMEEYLFKKAEAEFWAEIKQVVPVTSNSLKIIIQGLKRWVVFEEGEPQIAPEPILDNNPTWTKCMAPDSKDNLFRWVKDHWEEIKVLEKARAAAAKAAAMAG